MTWPDIRERAMRLAGLFRVSRAEKDLADELEFHLAMRSDKYERQGDANAAAHARRDLGSASKWKEVCRDVARARPLEDFVRDVLLAVRMLRKTPAFTAVALFTLALAVGANTAIFSLMNALVLRPLPVPNADRLVLLRLQPDNFGYSFCYPLFRYLEEHSSRVFSDVFAFFGHDFQFRTSSGTESVHGAVVSGGYFSGLRVPALAGRYLRPSDDRIGGGADGLVVVVSDRFRRNWFGGSDVVGRKILLDNVAFTIVGVMPDSFIGAEVAQRRDIFAPLGVEPLLDAPFNNIAAGHHSWWLRVVARLKDGVSAEQANAFLRATSRSIPDPQWLRGGRSLAELYVTAEAGGAGFCYLRLQFRKPLNALMVLVTIVLLIACLNVATLLMARSAAREREISTRFALGASRVRLVRQLLTESLLLAAAGTALGFAAAPVLARTLLAFLTSQQQPFEMNASPDIRVFAFTALIAAVATVLTGIAPALRSTTRELQHRMREASASLRGAERRRVWPRILLGCEVTLALVLVSGAGLLGYTLVQLHSIPVGFDPRGLLLLPLDMAKQSRDGEALVRVYHDIADLVAHVPGVSEVSLLNVIPISNSWWTGDVAAGQVRHELFRNNAGPDYFRVMRTPLLAGREFRWTDTDAAGRVAILNETAARQLFGAANPIGRRIQLEPDSKENKKVAEVVGVVSDARYATVRDAAPGTVYSPISQDVEKRPSYSVAIRVQGRMERVVDAASAVIRRVAPDIPRPVALTMDRMLDEALASERMMATLALFFAGIALLITGVGLYGTLAYTTERRTGEIGIRMALGAQRSDVMSIVCVENAAIALGGCITGLLISVAASRLIAGFLYSTSPRNPVILAAAALVMAAIAAAASLIPALHAARIDPITAIRYE